MAAFERWRARTPARLGIPDVAHRHRVDANAVAPQLTCQHAAHLHHAACGAANEGFADRGHAARVGTHRDDLAAAVPCHDAGGRLDRKRAGEPVGADVVVEVAVAHFLEKEKGRRIGTGTCAAGHQDVKATVALGNSIHHGTNRVAIGQVGLFKRGAVAVRSDLVDHRLSGFGIAAVDDHVRAAPRQLQRNGTTDEGRGTGDEGDLALKLTARQGCWVHPLFSCARRHKNLIVSKQRARPIEGLPAENHFHPLPPINHRTSKWPT